MLSTPLYVEIGFSHINQNKPYSHRYTNNQLYNSTSFPHLHTPSHTQTVLKDWDEKKGRQKEEVRKRKVRKRGKKEGMRSRGQERGVRWDENVGLRRRSERERVFGREAGCFSIRVAIQQCHITYN